MEKGTHGPVAEVVGPDLIAAVSPPTALSLPCYNLQEYVAAPAAAADQLP